MRNSRQPRKRDADDSSLLMYLALGATQCRLYRYDDTQPDLAEADRDIGASVSRDAGTAKLKLTEMNVPELEALRSFWNSAIDAALPLATRLDAEAKNAHDVDHNPRAHRYRLWRPDPVLVDFRTYPTPSPTPESESLDDDNHLT